MKKYLNVFMAVLLGVMSLSAPVQAEELPDLPALMISELQLGGLGVDGAADGRQEFIELYNPAGESLDVTGWKLEYLSAAHTGSGAATRVLADLKGLVGPLGFVLIGPNGLGDADVTWTVSSSASGYLAQGGGHVRLVDANGQVIELISWGNAIPIGSAMKLGVIPAGQSAQRVLPHHQDFTGIMQYKVSSEISPTGGALVAVQPPVRDCELRLSEIMPNPGGADSGHEYIELYNPTELPQSLADCSLRIGDAIEVLALPDQLVAAGGYIIIRDDTGFSLPNASAAIIWLLGGATQEDVQYADALQDDQVWWLREGLWEVSREGTPGAANELQSEKKTLPVVLTATHLPDECPAGKERNSETGRCRNIQVAIPIPEACKPGQIRNSETGRCRAVTAAMSAMPVACKLGQERNPETNRCRNTVLASVTPKSCPEGQVRNAETNRCRKQASAPLALATVDDVTGSGQSGVRWGVIVVVLAGLGAYALYEWRHDVLNILHRRQLKESKGLSRWILWQKGGIIKNK